MIQIPKVAAIFCATCIALLLGGIPAFSADAADPAPTANPRADLEAVTGELAALVGQGRIDQMLDRVGPIPDDERDDYEHTRTRLMNLYGNAGKYDGYGIAGFKALTPRFQVVYVLVYFERRPVMLEYGFYKINGKWRPQSFRIAANMKELLDTMPLQK